MTIARKQILVENEIRNYHCTVRCVRRAFLCGRDFLSGKDYEHRRQWIQERLAFLSEVFAMDIIGYSVQSNHLHVILRTRPDLAKEMSDEAVALRWLRLFPPAGFRGMSDWTPGQSTIDLIVHNPERLATCRRRLTDLSWFMRCLDERIARLANREDNCKGRFWEGRFKCKLLLDEPALLTCLVYVDLNPIRAGETKTPEESRFTSAYDRIQMGRKEVVKLVKSPESISLEPGNAPQDSHKNPTPSDWLCPFCDTAERMGAFQSISFDEYLYILDILGREIQPDKKGFIPLDLKPILQRLSIVTECWFGILENYENRFRRILGRASHVMEQARGTGLNWFHGIKACREVFGT